MNWSCASRCSRSYLRTEHSARAKERKVETQEDVGDYHPYGSQHGDPSVLELGLAIDGEGVIIGEAEWVEVVIITSTVGGYTARIAAGRGKGTSDTVPVDRVSAHFVGYVGHFGRAPEHTRVQGGFGINRRPTRKFD